MACVGWDLLMRERPVQVLLCAEGRSHVLPPVIKLVVALLGATHQH